MAEAVYGRLPFQEQVAFYRRKLNLPTTGWTDVHAHEHDWAFVVAGANRDAIVADFRAAVEKAIAEGTTLEDFRQDFDRIVAQHGWDYHGGRNWRSQVIYHTNMATSYAAGRWEQLQEAPYWQYQHSHRVSRPREEHLAWHGMVLSRDDPFWRTHFPPNGWGCRCSVRGLWDLDLQRMGKSGPDTAPAIAWEERTIGKNSPNGPRTVRVPQGIDPGFEYAPGRTRLQSAMPPEKPEGIRPGGAGSVHGHGLPNTLPSAALEALRVMPSSTVLTQGLAPETYVRHFLEPFGATLEQPAVVRDVIGEPLTIGKELFTTASGQWKVLKNGREQFLPLLAQAILAPDEIWVRLEWMYALKKAVVRRRYVAQFEVEGQAVPALAVFEIGADGWSGVTAFQAASQEYLDSLRVGIRLYERKP